MDEIIAKLDELEETIARIDTAIDDLSHKQIDISVLIDGQDKLDELRLFLEDLEAKDYTAKILIDIQDKDKLDALYLEIKDLELADHKVNLTVDTNGIEDATSKLKSLDGELANNAKALDKSKNSGDGFAFSMGMLAPLAIPAAAGILSLTGGVLGLVAAFGAVAAPGAAFLYSVKSMYTAASTLVSGLNATTQASLANATSFGQVTSILDKNSTAYQNMNSYMRNVITEYVLMKNALTQFQNAIQPQVQQALYLGFVLIENILTQITPAVQAFGTAFDGVLRTLLNRLQDPTFHKFFTDATKDIGTLVTDWGTGVINIVEGIAAILDAFLPLGVSMSGGFLKMTEAFDKWAQKLGSSEGFKKFISTVETDGPIILNILGQIALIIAKVVGAIGESSGNQGFLKFLDGLLKDLNGFLGTHEGLTQVTGDLLLMGVALAKFGPLLGPLTTFLATPVGAVVGGIVLLAGAFLLAYKNSKTFHDWVNANILPMLKGLGTSVQQMKQFFVQIWPEIQQVWQKYGGNILSILTGDLKSILGMVEGAMKLLEGIINIALGLLTGNWSQVWKGIEEVGSGAWKIITSFFSGFLNEIVSMASMEWKFMAGLWDSAWRGISSTFSTNLRDIEIFFGQMTTRVVGDAVQWGRDLLNAIVNGGVAVINWFMALPGRVVGALGNLGNLLVNAGENIIIGLINGISNEVGNLEGYLNDITSWITSWKGPPEKDKTLLQSAGESIMQGLIDGMESKYGAVHTSLSGFTNSLGQNFSKQLNTDIAARINAAVNTSSSGVSGALGGQGNLPGAVGSNSVSIASGAIVVNNPVAEPTSQTLARTLTTIAKFGILQAPAGTR